RASPSGAARAARAATAGTAATRTTGTATTRAAAITASAITAALLALLAHRRHIDSGGGDLLRDALRLTRAHQFGDRAATSGRLRLEGGQRAQAIHCRHDGIERGRAPQRLRQDVADASGLHYRAHG